ncbi:MAG: retropepsin-like aspartic protease, partial [Acidobacteriaceae bacterium]
MPRALPHSLLTFLTLICSAAALGQQTAVPFQFQDNLVRVPVTLNGQIFDAVLDSGTGGLGIDYAFAQSLHLDIGASIGMVPGGGQPEPMYPVILDHLDFGPEHLSFTPAVAVHLSHLTASAGFPVHLLLGLPVFRQNILRVDYPARTLTFLAAPPPCTDPIPFTLYGGTPLVAATVVAMAGGAPRALHLIVDLGTRHAAVLLGGPFLETADGQTLQAAGHAAQL